ncbi:MAG: FHA domain-containing protein [Woeseiaceae bacterium]
MNLGEAGLNEQPFRTHGKPLSLVSYASFEEALKVFEQTRTLRKGLCLLQGPTLSGKSTLIHYFTESLAEDASVAVVDGSGLNTTALLQSILRQFGYDLDQSSAGELLGMLRVFALHQAASHEPPLLFIENTHALNPSALRVLCELADLSVRGQRALKIVLASDRSLRPVVDAPVMASIARRVTHDFHLRPMTEAEAAEYLYAKLRAAGSIVPESVFPAETCGELWGASGGWPGILDRLALLSLAKAETVPVQPETVERPLLPQATWDEALTAEAEKELGPPPDAPTLFVTHDGQTIREMQFTRSRLIIGRSEHNDISIPSKFVSRHHTLLVRQGNRTFLMDLHSTNGTFVNTQRVSHQVLAHDDVIRIGNHRIKFNDPRAKKREPIEGMDFGDTAVMKTLEDLRRQLAKDNTAILPVLDDEFPASGA